MEEIFVISVKGLIDDGSGTICEKWAYATSVYAYGVWEPCWRFSEKDCCTFTSVEKAEEWFNYDSIKRELLKDTHNFDMSTLCIKKVVFESVKSLV